MRPIEAAILVLVAVGVPACLVACGCVFCLRRTRRVLSPPSSAGSGLGSFFGGPPQRSVGMLMYNDDTPGGRANPKLRELQWGGADGQLQLQLQTAPRTGQPEWGAQPTIASRRGMKMDDLRVMPYATPPSSQPATPVEVMRA